MKNICVLTEYFYPDDSGSSPTFISKLIKSTTISNQSIGFDIFTTNRLYRQKRILPKKEIWDSIIIHRVNLPSPQNRNVVFRYINNLIFNFYALSYLLFTSRKKYDLIIITSNPPLSAHVAYLYKKIVKIPYIYLIWDLYPDILDAMRIVNQTNIIFILFKYFQKKWIIGARNIICLGSAMRNLISIRYKIDIGNIVELNSWSNIEEITNSKQKEFPHKNKGSFEVLYAGNLGLAQDIDSILEAAKLIQERDSQIVFHIIGDGYKKDQISRRIILEKIGNVILDNFVYGAEYYDVLEKADVCLVLLEKGLEGLAVPSKTYSIMNSGKPIISLAGLNSEISHIINKYKCGIALNYGDVDGIVDSIIKLKNNRMLLEEYSKNASDAYNSNYSFHIVKDKFEAILISALG